MQELKFSEKSEERLIHVHPDLVSVVRKALDYGVMDFSVIEGVRAKDRQLHLVATGKSKTLNSKHLIQDDGYGHAVDLYPFPVDMEKVNKGDQREIFRFGVLAGLMKRAAKELGVSIINGADWDNDGETLDHTFFDAPHFELKS